MIIRQELSQQDKVNRLRFARTINREINNGTLDLQEVMWSDEAALHLNGQVKTWNTRYYADRGNRLADFIQERGQNQGKGPMLGCSRKWG